MRKATLEGICYGGLVGGALAAAWRALRFQHPSSRAAAAAAALLILVALTPRLSPQARCAGPDTVVVARVLAAIHDGPPCVFATDSSLAELTEQYARRPQSPRTTLEIAHPTPSSSSLSYTETNPAFFEASQWTVAVVDYGPFRIVYGAGGCVPLTLDALVLPMSTLHCFRGPQAGWPKL